MSSKSIIDVKDICFSYEEGNQIINNVSFSIYENEYVCVLGHNGSGKSTISKILMGLLEPSSGSIHLFDRLVTRQNAKYLRDNIGIVFQNPDSQFIGLTVEDDIAFGLENRNYDPKIMKLKIIEAAKRVGVETLLESNCQQLSGGQKQKVAIASVLAINSKIIIFDEATSMLDPKGKEDLKKMMVELRDIEKKTVISITHDMEEILSADRVIILKAGKLVEIGNPRKIFVNKERLQKLSLDFPFILKLSSLINLKKPQVPLLLNERELIDNLWKIK